jgi:hypothetical protein
MNRQDFTGYLQHPHSLEPAMKEDLRKLAESYSYCSPIQVLYTYLLQAANDHEANLQLKKAAAYTTSRRKLKELIESSLAPVPEEFSVIPDLLSEEPDATPAISVKDELMERVKKRLAEIAREKNPEIESPAGGLMTSDKVAASDSGTDLLSKGEIIEKFIREEPRISQPRASFFRPSEYAVRSNTDDADIVSETLARLYMDGWFMRNYVCFFRKKAVTLQPKLKKQAMIDPVRVNPRYS